METQSNLALPPIVECREESSFLSSLFSVLLGLLIFGGLIGAIIYQHWLYDELRFKDCKQTMISPIPNQLPNTVTP